MAGFDKREDRRVKGWTDHLREFVGDATDEVSQTIGSIVDDMLGGKTPPPAGSGHAKKAEIEKRKKDKGEKTRDVRDGDRSGIVDDLLGWISHIGEFAGPATSPAAAFLQNAVDAALAGEPAPKPGEGKKRRAELQPADATEKDHPGGTPPGNAIDLPADGVMRDVDMSDDGAEKEDGDLPFARKAHDADGEAKAAKAAKKAAKKAKSEG